MPVLTTMQCPHCRGVLKINTSETCGAFKCPRCRGTFKAPRVGRVAEKRRRAAVPVAAGHRPPAAAGSHRLLIAASVVLLAVGVIYSASYFQRSPASEPLPSQGAARASKNSEPATAAAPVSKATNEMPPPMQPAEPVVNAPAPAKIASEPAKSAPAVVEPAAEQIARNEPRPALPPQIDRKQPAVVEPRPAAAPAPRLTAEEKRIQEAVVRGVRYLQQSAPQDRGHAVGYAAFPGLALLECGVPASDPAVQQFARFVRSNSIDLRTTYELSLAVLFLDRLGDARDRKLIQSLGLRLVAGQNANGGWSYHCPVLTVPEEIELITFLKKNRPNPMPTPLQPENFPNLVPLDRPRPIEVVTPLPPNQTGVLTPLARVSREKLPTGIAKGDGEQHDPRPISNGEPLPALPPSTPEAKPVDDMPPAVQAIPAAAEPAVESKVEEPRPAEKRELFFPKKDKKGPPKFDRDDWRGGDDRPEFLKKALPTMQDRFAGKKPHRDDNSNTHFAILALWAARRHDVPMVLPLSLLDKRFRTSQYADGRWGYRFEGPGGARASMTAVGLLGLGIGHGNFREMWDGGVAVNNASIKSPPRQDPAIQKGLKALAQYIEEPDSGARSIEDLYFMWTVERVAVLYNLQTIDQRDWYRWGTTRLLNQQSADGSWHTGSYNGSSATIDTCMALLFLRKANLLEDLSRTIRPFVAAGE